MSDYFNTYISVIRYAMAPEDVVRSFFAKYEDTKDNTVLGALADYLEEQDDPRSIIVRRHLGQTKHPKDYSWKNDFYSDPHEEGVIISSGSVVNKGLNLFGFAPVSYRGIFNQKPKAVYINWNHRWAPPTSPHGQNLTNENHPLLYTNNTHLNGTFTPEEARTIADSLHPDQAEKVHTFLDSYFGPRNANHS